MPSDTHPDPFRADAALVYRLLEAESGLTVAQMADRLFPVASEGPETSIAALRRVSVRRILDSIVWMRHQGVVLTAVPGLSGVEGATFWLGVKEFDPLSVTKPSSVTDEVSHGVFPGIEPLVEPESESIMEIYHPK
jgi:hypothetical protein